MGWIRPKVLYLVPMGSIHRGLAGGATNQVRRRGKVSWAPLLPKGRNDGTRSMNRWLVGLLDSKYDEAVDERMLTLVCKQRRITSWTIGATQARFYLAA